MRFILIAFLLVSCGTGTATRVQSCSECRANEECVTFGGALYCSDPCIVDTQCLNLECGPLPGAEVYRTYWVCLPDEIPSNLGGVRRMGGDCGTPQYACRSDEHCLMDDTVSPPIYFCASGCASNSQCNTGCCYQTVNWGNFFCAPYRYCDSRYGYY
jgi:hypothetical protein